MKAFRYCVLMELDSGTLPILRWLRRAGNLGGISSIGTTQIKVKVKVWNTRTSPLPLNRVVFLPPTPTCTA